MLNKKKAIPKSYVQYDSIYGKKFKRQNHRYWEQFSGCQDLEFWFWGGLREGSGYGYKTAKQDFCGDGTILYLDYDGRYTNLHK